MSHLSQLVIELSFLDGLDGNKEGDKISLRFFPLLYSVLMELGGETISSCLHQCKE